MTFFKKIYWYAIWRANGLDKRTIKARFEILKDFESYKL